MPVDGMNVFFLLDRSDSVAGRPAGGGAGDGQHLVRRGSVPSDQGGVVVFGAEAAIESSANPRRRSATGARGVFQPADRSRGAIRLATAAFPETGQRRLLVFSDGNQTVGDALQAVPRGAAARGHRRRRSLGAAERPGRGARCRRWRMPNRLKQGQTFEVKVFAAQRPRTRANLSVYRNEQLLGTQPVELRRARTCSPSPRPSTDPGFHAYDVRIDAPGDSVPQNNRSDRLHRPCAANPGCSSCPPIRRRTGPWPRRCSLRKLECPGRRPHRLPLRRWRRCRATTRSS
jgi:Ca-activated chloride channel family protein